MTISDFELETRLRDLSARADDLAPPPRDLVQLTRERFRSERRHRIALGAAAVAAVLVFVGVPVLASTLAADPQRAEVATPSGRTFTPSPPTGLYALPTRGSLADDEEWLAAMTEQDWGPVDPQVLAGGIEVPDPPADSRRVAFAGDVPSGRVALILGMDGTRVAHAWFTGPRGAAPDQMSLATVPGHAGQNDTLALVDGSGPTAPSVTLVVVTEPGATVTRGLTPVVEASGEVRREDVDVVMDDGIGIAEIPTPWAWGALGPMVHVQGANAPQSMQMEDSVRLRGGMPGVGPTAAIADPRGLGDRIQRDQAEQAAAWQLEMYGLSEDQARPTLLAAGPLGTRVAQYGELYGMTHPSGATELWVVTYAPEEPDQGGQWFTFPPAPAGTALLDRVIAVRALDGVLVSAPAGTQAEVLDASGNVLTTLQLDRGSGTGSPDQRGSAVTVRILDGAGNVLAEAPIRDSDG